jgi:hypothetical protein
MKTIKYFVVTLLIAASFSSCIVRRPGWVRGHYDHGPRGGRHWVPGHYR